MGKGGKGSASNNGKSAAGKSETGKLRKPAAGRKASHLGQVIESQYDRLINEYEQNLKKITQELGEVPITQELGEVPITQESGEVPDTNPRFSLSLKEKFIKLHKTFSEEFSQTEEKSITPDQQARYEMFGDVCWRLAYITKFENNHQDATGYMQQSSAIYDQLANMSKGTSDYERLNGHKTDVRKELQFFMEGSRTIGVKYEEAGSMREAEHSRRLGPTAMSL